MITLILFIFFLVWAVWLVNKTRTKITFVLCLISLGLLILSTYFVNTGMDIKDAMVISAENQKLLQIYRIGFWFCIITSTLTLIYLTIQSIKNRAA